MRSPRVRTYSFLRFLRHLLDRDCWFRASQRCACLPSLTSLGIPELRSIISNYHSHDFSSVPDFVVHHYVRYLYASAFDILHCIPHGKPACGLLTGFTNSPVGDLHPLEYLTTFGSLPMPGAHTS